MCKYKHSLRKIETSYIVAFLNGTNCRFVDYKSGIYFYSCPALGNSLSVPQKVHDFRYRK